MERETPSGMGSPLLRGKRWWLFLALWTIVLAFAAVGAWRYVGEASVRTGTTQRYGLQMRDESVGDPATVQFTLGDEAVRAGVRPGDHVDAVNGRRIDADHPFDAQLEAAGAPAEADVTLSSREGTRRVRLHASPAHAADGFGRSGITADGRVIARTAIFLLSLFVIPVGLAILLLIRRSGDPLAPWVSLAMVVNALGSGPALYTLGAADTDLFGTAVAIACPFAGWAQIAVLAMFPSTHGRAGWTRAVVLGALPLMYWMRLDSSVLATNSALLVGQFAAVAVVVRRYLDMAPGIGRQQIRWALFGFGASLVAQALTIVVQKVFFATADPVIYVWLNLVADVLAGLSTVLLYGALTLGLMRYRLYDADATISRSVAYGALTLSLLAIFAGSEKVIEVLGEEYLGSSLGVLASGLGAAFAAAMIGPLHHRVTDWAEKRFRSGLVHLRQGLPRLVGDLRETATPRALADAMLARVESGVRARHGAVVIGDTAIDVRDVDPAEVAAWLGPDALPRGRHSAIEVDRSDPLFPMRVPLASDATGLVGWLLLGPRPDGTFYGREEREALLEIADPVARALAIALEREQREASWRAREDARDRRFEALQRFVRDRFGFDADVALLPNAT